MFGRIQRYDDFSLISVIINNNKFHCRVLEKLHFRFEKNIFAYNIG